MIPELSGNKVHRMYQQLYSHYGPRGWWPIQSRAGTRGFDSRGYHINDFSYPRSGDEIFEVIVGAILTQNTAWINVEKAMMSLVRHGLLTPSGIIHTPVDDIAAIIRSSGYYNQKAKKLKIITQFVETGNYLTENLSPRREDLLSLWGIGPETADSILLYGFNMPYFVVDGYTKRIFTRTGLIRGTEHYSEIQQLCTAGTDSLDSPARVRYYNEYHALIVVHGKDRCKTKPECPGCPLAEFCGNG